jgi:hypothetical protein
MTLERSPVVFTQDGSEATRGFYSFPSVPAGRYALHIRRVGYTRVRDSVTILPGQADTIRIELSVYSGCDIGCDPSDVVTARRPWWKFWQR